jgi:hypothetical protein
VFFFCLFIYCDPFLMTLKYLYISRLLLLWKEFSLERLVCHLLHFTAVNMSVCLLPSHQLWVLSKYSFSKLSSFSTLAIRPFGGICRVKTFHITIETLFVFPTYFPISIQWNILEAIWWVAMPLLWWPTECMKQNPTFLY